MSSPLPGWEFITTRTHGSSGASSEVDDGLGVNSFEREVDQLSAVHPSPRKGARMTTGPRPVKRYSDGYAVASSSGALKSEHKPEGTWTRLFDRNDRPLKRQKTITDEPGSASASRIRGSTSSSRDNDHEKPRRVGPAGLLQRGRTLLPHLPSRLQNRPVTTANSYIVNQVTGVVEILDSEDDDGKGTDSANGEDEGSGHEQGDKGDGDDGDVDDDGEEEEGTVRPRRVLQLARKSTGGKMPAAQLASLNRARAQTPAEGSNASSESEEGLPPPKVMARTTPSTFISTPAAISTPTARKPRPPAPAPAPRSRKPTINNPLSQTHSVVLISSDDSEHERSSNRTPRTPQGSSMVNQSDSAKARNRFTDAGQASRLGALFARLPFPQEEADALGGASWTALGQQPQLPEDAQTSRRTSPTKQTTLDGFAKKITRGVQGRALTVGELIRAPPSTTTRRVSAPGNFTHATPSDSTVEKIARLAGSVSLGMGYTPPSSKSARDRAQEPGDHKLPPQSNMEQALGLEGTSATHRIGDSREKSTNTGKAKQKGKARATAISHAITPPPTTAIKVQPVSPEVIADKKKKGRTGERPQRGMTIAEAIQESGAINQARGPKTESSTKKKKKKRKVPGAPINVSGFGSKDDPLDLTLDPDDRGNASILKPRAAEDSGSAAQIPIPLVTRPEVEVTKGTIVPPAPVRVAPPVPPRAVQAAVFPSAQQDPVTRKRTNSTPPTPLPTITTSKLRGMLDESRASVSAMKEKELVQSSTLLSTVTGPVAASLNTLSEVQQPLRLQPSIASANSLPVSQIPIDRGVDRPEVFTSHRSPSKDRLRSSSGSSSGEHTSTVKAAKGRIPLPLPSTTEIAPDSNPPSQGPHNRVRISSGTGIPQPVEVQVDPALDGDEDEMALLLPLTGSLAGPAVLGVKTEDEPEQVSDLDGVMEVDELLLPPSWESSSEMEDITTALEVQEISSAEQSPLDRSLEPSVQGDSSALQTPAAEDFGDPDFGIASEDDHQAGLSHLVARMDTQALLTKQANIFEGFEIVTFEDYRNETKTQPFEVYWSRDLPHELQDLFNASSMEIQTAPQMRKVLQAYIQEHTTDEPDAPLIEIINNIDDEAIPPWEYHYSNRMWYADEIPPPDIKNLKGCDCIGRCDPKSKTCICMQRQWKDIYNSTGIQSLAYDKAGRLKLPGCVVPVHECNVLCGCDEGCMNRVVQNGRKVAVSIQKTKNKGWGVFAGAKKIPKGSFLGIYAGELISEQESERRGEVYNKFGRTYLFDVDFWFLPGKEEEGDDWEPKFIVDAYHAGNFTRYLNHSCNPNAKIHPCYINEANPAKPSIVIFSDRDIEPFEEICFSYHGNEDDDFDSQGQDKNNDDAIYVPCMCEAANCKGRMFS